ncbi:GyrI-like domain-containing protein [uncultured Clostridium sp.]|uniref:GyrI-like domain-containing protein n=1 Tax=uncultured Clostridium sp. TaxID=59620 RepID=UPI0028E982DC|nr:GyrI-like domain-containing protein [uncultured Clostridium sp.]
MGKIDFKKEFKELYNPSSKEIQIVNMPKLNYLMTDGTGNPNTSQEYKEAIEALFSVSYAIKFMIKKGATAVDYGVLPLEGLWWIDNMEDFSTKNKDIWNWTALIMQPEFVDEDLVHTALEEVTRKKNLPSVSKIRFKSIEEGLVAQVMYIGPYSEEAPTIERLHNYIDEMGYIKVGKHHEIYLNDARRTAPEKLKTILRQPIAKK